MNENLRQKADKSIVLIGLMGAGKTKIGTLLARALDLGFSDSDHVIETRAVKPITQIFAEEGEQAFRALERTVIEDLLSGPRQVIATGGGAVMTMETAKVIWARSLSIWLDADLDVLVERTARSDHRPLLKTGDPRKILGDLQSLRNPVYAQADIHIKSDHAPANVTLERVLKALAPFGIEKHSD